MNDESSIPTRREQGDHGDDQVTAWVGRPEQYELIALGLPSPNATYDPEPNQSKSSKGNKFARISKADPARDQLQEELAAFTSNVSSVKSPIPLHDTPLVSSKYISKVTTSTRTELTASIVRAKTLPTEKLFPPMIMTVMILEKLCLALWIELWKNFGPCSMAKEQQASSRVQILPLRHPKAKGSKSLKAPEI
jgi:hypothetical protein